MAKITLNDKAARRAPPETGQVELWDNLLPGFGLRISAGNSRTFFVMKRVNGRLVRRTIGKHPPLHVLRGARLAEGELWIPEARAKARITLADLARGIDPMEVARDAGVATEEAQAATFKAIADKYLADKLRGGGAELRTRAELERKLETDLKAWHYRPIAEIKGREIRELIRAKAQTAPISSNRLLSFVKRVFRWAAAQEYIDADPAAAVDKPGKEQARDRYLTEDEVRLVWLGCEELGDPAGRLYKIALLTGQRRGEIAGMRRSELGQLQFRVADPMTGRETMVARNAWLLPAERTKRGVAHTVPLSPTVERLLADAPKLKILDKVTDHIFISGRAGDQPLDGWSKFKTNLDEIVGRQIAKEAEEDFDPDRHALPPWHIHDLRATVATHFEMERMSVPRSVISRVLNHAEGDGRSMTARYVRHTWDREAAEALDRWALEVARIVGLNVVMLDEVQA